MADTIIISRKDLEDKLLRIFDVLHVSRDDSKLIADTLIQAEQWGVTSHGVLRVEHYVRCLQSGGILPDAEFTVQQQCGSWVRTSANSGLGIPASCEATIGNNPFAYAVPAGKYHTLMMDVAMCRG